MKDNIKCFVRLNTEKIKSTLKELNIPHNDYDSDDREWIAFNYGMWISISPVWKTTVYTSDNELDLGIDCGTDEELFFGLVALHNKDKDDYKQFFVQEDDQIWINQGRYSEKGSLCLSLVKKFPTDNQYHKASPEELVAWFKKEAETNPNRKTFL